MFLDTCILFEILIVQDKKFIDLIQDKIVNLNNLVFFELGNLILARTKNASLAVDILSFIRVSNQFQILDVMEKDIQEGLLIMSKYSEHKLSIVDCVSLAQSKRKNWVIFTNDFRMSLVKDSQVNVV